MQIYQTLNKGIFEGVYLVFYENSWVAIFNDSAIKDSKRDSMIDGVDLLIGGEHPQKNPEKYKTLDYKILYTHKSSWVRKFAKLISWKEKGKLNKMTKKEKIKTLLDSPSYKDNIRAACEIMFYGVPKKRFQGIKIKGFPGCEFKRTQLTQYQTTVKNTIKEFLAEWNPDIIETISVGGFKGRRGRTVYIYPKLIEDYLLPHLFFRRLERMDTKNYVQYLTDPNPEMRNFAKKLGKIIQG